MAQAPILGLEARQTLQLTPQLKLAIRILQLPHHELEAELRRAAEENPFLRVEFREPRAALTAPERPVAPEDPDGWTAPEPPPAADWSLGPAGSRAGDGDGLPDPVERLSRPPDLRDWLRLQLAVDVAEPAVRDLALELADLVDDDGYLRPDDGELAAMLGRTPAEVAAARRRLQACEPVGVGARDLAECLALQLRERGEWDALWEGLLARLDLVARGDRARLARELGVEAERLAPRLERLRRLEPRPGAAFGGETATPLLPDLLVRRVRGRWRVEMNTALLPRVLVDRAFWAELGSRVRDRGERRYLTERLQDARGLARAVAQRTRTLLRVGRAVFRHQRAFLEAGPGALRPLTLREVAEELGIHESTVSRAVAGKAVETPFGVLPLRYFFTAALADHRGEATVAAEAVRRRIRELIAREDPARPLSDERIARLLAAEGVRVARRTVAKYREALGIPGSAARRRG